MPIGSQGCAAVPGRATGRARRPGRSNAVIWLAVVVAAVIAAVGRADGPPGIRWLSADAGTKVEPGVDLADDAQRSMLVQAVPGRGAEARLAITGTGAAVDAELDLVHGYQAALTGPQVATLSLIHI